MTAADHASEALIIERLAEAFPGHAVLSEETRPHTDWRRGYVWVVDPLDGTRNFAAEIPIYCVNVALALDGVPLLGATYDPSRNVCVLGGPGLGLTVNGEPAGGSRAPDLLSSVLLSDLGHEDQRAGLTLDLLRELWPGLQAIRIVGSAALGLAWTATGLVDVMVHSHLWPWDIAAALAQVPAGGGVMLDRDGGAATLASDGIIAGAPGPARELAARTAGRPWR